jgi:prophage antirepressor-like protein
MTSLTVFNFDSQEIRFVDGKPVANDVAKVLGYADPQSTISKKVDAENKGVAKMATRGGSQSVTVLEEAGIYQLIFGSKLPSAKAFQKWVFSDVLPSIRKTGSYSVTSQQSSLPPFWYQRLMLDLKTNPVPNGYFSIFREVIPLVADLETAGYVLPDNAVPDISVGKTWANYLKSQGIAINSVARQYPHTYPDNRGVQDCNCYPESMLPTFRQWFR